MPCLLGCVGLFFPRLLMVLLVVFSDWLGDAYETILWPLLGFFFLPYTTLAYALAWHLGEGDVEGLGVAIIVLGVLLDLGALGTGAQSGRRRWRTTKLVRVKRD